MWTSDGLTIVWRREYDMTGMDGRDTRCVVFGYCNRGGPAFSIMAVGKRITGVGSGGGVANPFDLLTSSCVFLLFVLFCFVFFLFFSFLFSSFLPPLLFSTSVRNPFTPQRKNAVY